MREVLSRWLSFECECSSARFRTRGFGRMQAGMSPCTAGCRALRAKPLPALPCEGPTCKEFAPRACATGTGTLRHHGARGGY